MQQKKPEIIRFYLEYAAKLREKIKDRLKKSAPGISGGQQRLCIAGSGSAVVLSKSFTVDFLTKKTKINEGEVPQCYIEDSQPAIIEPWAWEQVQVERERRKNSRNQQRQTSPFSGKIRCTDRGNILGTKTWHSTNQYRCIVW